MGQMFAVNKMPKKFHNKVIKLLNDPSMSQAYIVNSINTEAGKKIITQSSLNRFIRSMENNTGTKRGIKPPTAEEALTRIASALERLVFYLENQS